MANFTDLLQEYVNKDFTELCSLASFATDDILLAAKRILPEENPYNTMLAVLQASVAADGELTEREEELIANVFGLGKKEINKLAKMNSTTSYAITEKFMALLTSKEAASLLVFVTAVAACDETIDRNETAFIKQLLEA